MSSSRRPATRVARPQTTAGLDARVHLRNRPAARRRPRARVLLAVALAIAMLAGLGWVALGSRLLGVQEVTVTGAVRLSEGEVLQAAQAPAGQPLLRVDVDAVARRVSALPATADVRVSRRWPNTLHLSLRERTPVAAVPVTEGVVLVDATGVPFAKEQDVPAGLGLLRVSNPGADDVATRAGVTVMADLPEELSALVTAVRVDAPASVVLELSGGRRAIWGDAGQGAKKAAALSALLLQDQRDDDQGQTYDVSAPGVVTVRR